MLRKVSLGFFAGEILNGGGGDFLE